MEALGNNQKIISVLPVKTSVVDRVKTIAPMVMSAIESYEAGNVSEGIVAFQEALVELIKAGG